uniref:F-box domain-containing protein n=1 Tax=Romanomermis culicivorax TaxID=13658 RepID=A0A915J8F6_ROMCU
MNDLPSEILSQIFQYFPVSFWMKSLRRVNQKWFRVIENMTSTSIEQLSINLADRPFTMCIQFADFSRRSPETIKAQIHAVSNLKIENSVSDKVSLRILKRFMLKEAADNHTRSTCGYKMCETIIPKNETLAHIFASSNDDVLMLEHLYWKFVLPFEAQFIEDILDTISLKAFHTLKSFEIYGLVHGLLNHDRLKFILERLSQCPNLRKLGFELKFNICHSLEDEDIELSDDEHANELIYDFDQNFIFSKLLVSCFVRSASFPHLENLIVKNFALYDPSLNFSENLAFNLKSLKLVGCAYDNSLNEILLSFCCKVPNLENLHISYANLKARAFSNMLCAYMPNLRFLRLKRFYCLDVCDFLCCMHDLLHFCSENRRRRKDGKMSTQVLEICVENFYHAIDSTAENNYQATAFCGVMKMKCSDRNCDIYKFDRYTCTFID